MNKSNKDKEMILRLFTDLKQLFLIDNSIINKTPLIDTLNTAIIKVNHVQQTPKLEARSVFTNISQYCFVDGIKLTKEESKIMNKINSFSHSGGIWGEMNTLSTTNFWPSN